MYKIFTTELQHAQAQIKDFHQADLDRLEAFKKRFSWHCRRAKPLWIRKEAGEHLGSEERRMLEQETLKMKELEQEIDLYTTACNDRFWPKIETKLIEWEINGVPDRYRNGPPPGKTWWECACVVHLVESAKGVGQPLPYDKTQRGE